MNQGVAISSNANGDVRPGGGGINLDLKACAGATAYLGAMANSDGSGENCGISCYGTGRLEIRSNLDTYIQTANDYGIILATKVIETYKYGTTDLVHGIDGYCKIGNGCIGFANGICVYLGTKEADCKATVGTSGPLFTIAV